MNKEVVLGVVVYNNNLLIVRRKANEGKLLWQFPGGEIEENETREEAIIREIKEETGLECQIEKCLGERFHPYTKRQMSYWCCKYLNGNFIFSDEEIAEAKWININDLNKYFTTDLFEPVLLYLNSYK